MCIHVHTVVTVQSSMMHPNDNSQCVCLQDADLEKLYAVPVESKQNKVYVRE